MAFGGIHRSNLPTAARQTGAARVSVPPSGGPSILCLRRWVVAVVLAITAPSNDSVQAQPAPEPLRITTLRPEYERFIVEWTGGLPPYAVEVSINGVVDWARISPLLRETAYADLHIDARPAGLYRVLTFPDTTRPPQPKGLSAPAVKCDRAALVWDPQDDEADGSGIWGYKVYRDGHLLRKIRAPNRYFTDEFLLSATNYTYQVSALDRAGNESELSPSATITTPDCISPNETNLVVDLSWDRSEDTQVVGYLVCRGVQPGVYDWQIDVMQDTSYAFEDLSPGVTYFLSVTAYDADGVQSDPAGEIVVIP